MLKQVYDAASLSTIKGDYGTMEGFKRTAYVVQETHFSKGERKRMSLTSCIRVKGDIALTSTHNKPMHLTS